MFKFGIYEKALPKNNFQEQLKRARQIGYDFWEMSVDPSKIDRLFWDKESIYKMKAMCDYAELPIYNMVLSAHRDTPLGSIDEGDYSQARNYLMKATDLAVKLGIRTIQIAGYYNSNKNKVDGSRERYVRNLKQCVDYAQRNGVMLGIENVDYDIVDGITISQIISEVNSPYLKAYPDVGNFAANGLDEVNELEVLKNNIVGIHFKDTKINTFRRIDFNCGIVNFDKILSYLLSIKYEGYIGIEMWEDDKADSLSKVSNAIKFIKNKFN
ncbi:L-ribulose-5-phosphate 3-epimerase [Aerococcus christensenii]|uniref:L-ribulose-5-phosphate 3-epimerase n=1 Tax=Aerococcus christensenii TaxID=87541 RepID=A0A109RCB6_9LACT|nr:L-ribulose-5-phosphate 3-epimerase [Aerococcus christensenii]AMB92481.1 hypothetical protein AWM71_03815 [Aerococcus christensenii]PKY91034.1 L-ribulose-5-phosphate 3-epimerase [Aerococcus christensenii]